MALNAYVEATQLLLSNPAAPTSLYSTANITQFINTARTQLAGESECCRTLLTLSTTGGVNNYAFQNTFPSFPFGISGLFNIRQMWINSGSGMLYMGSRPFPWAANYWLNNASPVQGQPTEWSQYCPGASQTSGVGGGLFYLNPTPNTAYTLKLDVAGIPGVLVTDSDPEAIPYAYTDCVPYFAAFYAYMSAQRQQDADLMYARYEKFLARAQGIAVPNVLPRQYDQYDMMKMHMSPAPTQSGGG